MWGRGPESVGRFDVADGSSAVAGSRLQAVRSFGDAEDNMAVVHDTSATLAQCVLITIAGYISSRWRLLSDEQLQGIEKFTSNFALPALMFTNMAALDLEKAHPDLIIGIFLAKVVVLVAVVGAAFFLTAKDNRPWNVIGLYGIFATMCNDFGIALPVLRSLFGADLSSELYLIAFLGFCILNPICIYLMEFHQQKKAEEALAEPQATTSSAKVTGSFDSVTSGTPSSSRISLLGKVILRTAFHPHVMVCLLGLFFNISGWQAKVPTFINSSLQVISESFASLILFLLGCRLNPQGDQRSDSSHRLSVITLSIMKTVALPILCLIGVRLLSGSVALSNFAFIYGAVPTPPLVTVYAIQYRINPQQISTAVCVSSVVSLPLLFVAIKATALTIAQPETSDYEELFSSLVPGVLSLAAVNLVCGFLVIIYLTALSSRYTRLPFHFLLCLCLSQIVQSMGLLFWHVPHVVLEVYPVFFVTCGQMSGRLFLAFFALSISPSLAESPKLAGLKRTLTLIGFSFPALTTLAMYIWAGSSLLTRNHTTALPLFLNGRIEMVIFACVLSFSLCAVFGSLIDDLFRETGLSSPVARRHPTGSLQGSPAVRTSTKPARHQAKHMFALVALSGSAFVGLVHTYWRISAQDVDDRPLLMAVEFLDGYMAFSQAAVILVVYGIHSKYYSRLERLIFASRILSFPKQLFHRFCGFPPSSTVAVPPTNRPSSAVQIQAIEPALISFVFGIAARSFNLGRPPIQKDEETGQAS